MPMQGMIRFTWWYVVMITKEKVIVITNVKMMMITKEKVMKVIDLLVLLINKSKASMVIMAG